MTHKELINDLLDKAQSLGFKLGEMGLLNSRDVANKLVRSILHEQVAISSSRYYEELEKKLSEMGKEKL